MKLSGARVGRDAGRIADEVIAHLAALPGATVDVTLEVHVKVGEGVEEDVVRVCRQRFWDRRGCFLREGFISSLRLSRVA